MRFKLLRLLAELIKGESCFSVSTELVIYAYNNNKINEKMLIIHFQNVLQTTLRTTTTCTWYYIVESCCMCSSTLLFCHNSICVVTPYFTH